MKCVHGVWLPQDEQHLVGMLASSRKIDGKGTYQYDKLMRAMQYVPRRKLALDIGAHVGLWSMHLVKLFREVVAFEPVPTHIECLKRNVQAMNFGFYPCALGDKVISVGIGYESGSSGGTHLRTDIQGATTILRLDDFEFDDEIDFIKIDVEGYERFVVEGGEQTIRTNRPVIVIEQKPKGLAERYGQQRFAALDLLKSWGAQVKFEMSGDYGLAWPT